MQKSIPTTEQESNFSNLEKMETAELLKGINSEDQKIAAIIDLQIPKIESLVDAIVSKMKLGGRLFYIGAGTSGRLGVLDASECPPTFGVSNEMVIGLIAGGDHALRSAVENAEDNITQAWIDLNQYKITPLDVIVGIAASGNTPYVIGGLRSAREHNVTTGSIACNANCLISKEADFPIEIVVGPEFVTGSTRMKSGTAQKLVLNMISTSVMIKLGKVKGNKMVDMQLSNHKLVNRGVKMIMDEINISEELATSLLMEHKNVRSAIAAYTK